MTKDLFVARLRKIKELDELLEKSHNKMVRENPLVEDAYGVMPSWMTDLILEHVVTLFASVNEIAYYKTRLESTREYYKGKTLEEIAEDLNISVDRLRKENENVYVLRELASYFVCEMNWGGLISIGKDDKNSVEYDFKDYGRLYDYIKEEV